MSALAMMAIGIGAVAVLGKLPGILAPSAMRAGLVAFPRSRVLGRFLAALDLVVSAWLVWDMPESWFTPYRQSLWVLCPLSIVLVCVFLDELLAARALGGLLLLAAAPVLDIARFHPSPARLVMVVLAYLWVIPGLLIVSNPWWFRKLAAPMAATDLRCRLASAAGVSAGLVLIALGIWVY